MQVREMVHKVRWLSAVLIVGVLAVGGRGGGALVYSSPIVSGLYVPNTNAGSITVYALDADGDVRPIRIIDGILTQLGTPVGVALGTDGTLYVANKNRHFITVYAPGAGGTNLRGSNVAPLRTIRVPPLSSGRFSSSVTVIFGVALDAKDTLYVSSSRRSYGRITAYAPGASGNDAPRRTISGVLNFALWTGLDGPVGVALDDTGSLYVANSNGSSITVYAPGARGIAAPLRTIRGALTGLGTPVGVTLDAAGRLYVSNYGANSITVYAPGATGNVAPLRTISGTLTGLSSPAGVALDADGRLYVSNYGANSITVYAPGAIGNVAPLRAIRGASTRLNAPFLISLRP